MLRCFAAVEVASPVVRRALEGAQLELRRAFGTPAPVKWVPAHQFHLTLKFLGEVAPEAADRAVGALQRAAGRQSAFTVRLAGLGAFPGAGRPSVLWAGVGGGAAELGALAEAVEGEMAQDGFPRERRPFSPHLTLGRVREGSRVPAAIPQALAASAGRAFGEWRVVRVVLMRSELTPRGPVYSVHGIALLREESEGKVGPFPSDR